MYHLASNLITVQSTYMHSNSFDLIALAVYYAQTEVLQLCLRKRIIN